MSSSKQCKDSITLFYSKLAYTHQRGFRVSNSV